MSDYIMTPWNYEAYAAIPCDEKRHKIVDGDHLVNPAPNLYHQTVSRRLQFQLCSEIELKEIGVVFNAPVDVQLTDHDTEIKRTAKERCCVPEYWIVDPEDHKVLQLVHIDGAFREQSETESITMHGTPHTQVDLTKVW